MGQGLVRSLILSTTTSLVLFAATIGQADDCQTILNPEAKLTDTKAQNPVEAFRDHLEKTLPDQQETIDALVHKFEKLALGLHDTGPIGKFLVSSLPGIDRTMVADALASFFSGDPNDVIRIDCRNPQLEPLLALTASESQGQVHIIQFEHIEQANSQLSIVLDQILKRGALQLQEGKVISFHNTFLIMTTDVGEAAADAILSHKEIGFRAKIGNDRKNDPELLKEAAVAARAQIKEAMPSTIYKSFDKVLILRVASEKQIEAQVNIFLQRLQSKVANHPEMEVGVLLSPKMKMSLITRAKTDSDLLHEDLDRLEVSVGRLINQGSIKKGSVVELDGPVTAPQIISVKEGMGKDSIKALLQ